jgi:hypothetical protein
MRFNYYYKDIEQSPFSSIQIPIPVEVGVFYALANRLDSRDLSKRIIRLRWFGILRIDLKKGPTGFSF